MTMLAVYPHIQGVLLGLLACGISFLLYPPVLHFARRKNIVDNPDARKLQREPVPVLGGLVVAISFFLVLALHYALNGTHRMLVGSLAVLVMTGMGIWDDLKNLPAAFRFVVELVVVWLITFWLGEPQAIKAGMR